jgi:quercetin 2,3-dioxygenase
VAGGVREVEVRRSDERFLTVAPARPDAEEGWAVTRHSFSFGEHYDPGNVGFGPLVALNDETVRAGEAYPEHLHRDTEIVSWVVDGTLRHADSEGHLGLAGTGTVQRLSTGSGVRHTEGATDGRDVRFLQAWVRPDETGTPPSYALGTVGADALAAGWVAVASGEPGAVVDLRSRGTTLWVTRLDREGRRTLPAGRSALVMVVRGAVELDGIGALDAGDAARLSGRAPLAVLAREAAEVLVWTFAS